MLITSALGGRRISSIRGPRFWKRGGGPFRFAPEAGSRKPEAGSRKPEAGSRKPTWRHGGAMTRRHGDAREWRGDAMTHAMRWLTYAMTRRRDNARDDPATHPVTR
ncbi:hypothetical protein ACH4VS_28625 [Streptomyces hygroscopicus]|uniref:hypothetical protein n=1 Tax=Streptomyces hygroscopicus TaxID=1912 RepID=UPI00117E56D5|nr:hypothetical protein [Streptomyces hygroscopicus]